MIEFTLEISNWNFGNQLTCLDIVHQYIISTLYRCLVSYKIISGDCNEYKRNTYIHSKCRISYA